MSKRQRASVPTRAPSNQSPQSPPSNHSPHHIVHHSVKQFTGPIPDPEAMALYERVLPGSCERILTMAEENASHVRRMGEKALLADIEAGAIAHKEKVYGQAGALLSVAGAFALAALAMILKFPVVAGIICSTTVIGLAAVFITSRVVSAGAERKENEKSDGQAEG